MAESPNTNPMKVMVPMMAAIMMMVILEQVIQASPGLAETASGTLHSVTIPGNSFNAGDSFLAIAEVENLVTVDYTFLATAILTTGTSQYTTTSSQSIGTGQTGSIEIPITLPDGYSGAATITVSLYSTDGSLKFGSSIVVEFTVVQQQYVCPYDNEVFGSLTDLFAHISAEHPDKIVHISWQ